MAEANLNPIPFPVTKRHDCPHCGVKMRLVSIEPDSPGFDYRTYECWNCWASESLVMRIVVRAEPIKL